MTTTLPETWRGEKEPSTDDVDIALRSRIAEITKAARDTVKATGDSQAENAINAVENIYLLAAATTSLKSYAQSKNWQTLGDRLTDFESELAMWRRMLAGFSSNEAKQNARTRFSDMTTWATHFSMVRMTLSTFFITAAWGLVTLKWNEYSDGLWYASVAAWALAGAFLFLFTWALHDASDKREDFKSRMGDSLSEPRPPWLILILGLLCAVPGLFWLVLHVINWPSFGSTGWPIALCLVGALLLVIASGNNWGPIVIYVFMSVGFGLLLYTWKTQEQITAIAWTSLVDQSSITQQQAKAGVKSIDMSNLGTKLDELKKSVDQVALKLTAPPQVVTPVPTATATSTPSPKSKLPPRRRGGGRHPNGQ
jgi:hypothetical protein